MKFFDAKEQVLDIELTQHGKRILAQGTFEPTYYAFFDDDILYDTKYAGNGELQNNSETRIQSGTPRLQAQYTFKGVETKINNTANDANLSRRLDERHDLPPNPMGASSINSDKLPAWSIHFLESQLTGSRATLTGSTQSFQIPQLEVTPSYKIEISTTPDLDLLAAEEEDSESFFDIPTIDFEDGTTISVRQEAIVLEVIERNVDFDVENFDIEVYEVELGNLYQLHFHDPPEFMDKEDLDPDPSYVEHYFEIQVDDEIEPEILVNVNGRQNMFSDSQSSVASNKARKDIYSVPLDPEDFEDCDRE